jgi:hypothetical protein
MPYRSCNRFEKTCIGLITKPILFVRRYYDFVKTRLVS